MQITSATSHVFIRNSLKLTCERRPNMEVVDTNAIRKVPEPASGTYPGRTFAPQTQQKRPAQVEPARIRWIESMIRKSASSQTAAAVVRSHR
jgi:hypothetical protein